jgi:hypothetical protein
MKNTNTYPTIAIVAIIFFTAGCRSNRTVTKSPYPTNKPVVVVTTSPGNLPPGQAKKVYGTQSAKPFAPGQRKKYYRSTTTIPLILVRTPQIVLTKHPEAGYYFRNAEGLIYWQGEDSRLYLDPSHISKVKYTTKEYEDWKNNGKSTAKNNAAKPKESRKNSNKKSK